MEKFSYLVVQKLGYKMKHIVLKSTNFRFVTVE